jgi:hypothetical protein
MWVTATVGAVAPTNLDDALLFVSGQGEKGDALAELYPGLAGANRLYAITEYDGDVFVSYA